MTTPRNVVISTRRKDLFMSKSQTSPPLSDSHIQPRVIFCLENLVNQTQNGSEVVILAELSLYSYSGRQTSALSFFYTSTFSKFWKFTPKKRVIRDILNLKPYIFGVFIHLIRIISQFSYISAHFTHVQWVNIVWYYQKLNHITSIGPKTHPQSELLPEW